MRYYAGIDLGGTFIKLSVIDETGQLIGKEKTETPKGCEYFKAVETIARGVEKLAAEKGVHLDGAGIGSPGVIDGKNGVVVTSNNLGWEKKPLAEDLSSALQMPVHLTNDANAAALGEYAFGAGKNYESLVLLTIGTGIGSGIVIDGKLFEGNCGAGAELGHMTIRCDGIRCSCGRRGCYEVYASASALIRQTKEAMRRNKSSRMWEFCGGRLSAADGRTAFDAMRLCDDAAAEVVERYIGYLAEGIADIVNLFRPQAILLGGGISAEKEFLTKPLQERVNALILGKGTYAPVKIETASLGNDAGIYGAAKLAMER